MGFRFEEDEAERLAEIQASPARSAAEWRRKGEGWYLFAEALFRRSILVY
jgi:hypothetical protein